LVGCDNDDDEHMMNTFSVFFVSGRPGRERETGRRKRLLVQITTPCRNREREREGAWIVGIEI